ncbi:hypothetical protein [Rhizobium sp. BR 314]|uniref:hypothetical protein n=1 Tax=Rhizobium sp. BR 314 TaxID=3040013 RepID=UPI0039BF87D5
MMIDKSFSWPREPIAIVAIGDSGEALLLRAILESLGAVVLLHLPGTPDDVLKCLDQGAVAPEYIILSGHGDDTGFVLGEFVEGIDTSALVKGSLPPVSLMNRIDLPGKVVLSTACLTGSEAFAQAFLSGGVRAYIAPAEYPDGAAIPLFVHGFFYHLLQKQASLEESLKLASAFDEAELAIALFKGTNIEASTGS